MHGSVHRFRSVVCLSMMYRSGCPSDPATPSLQRFSDYLKFWLVWTYSIVQCDMLPYSTELVHVRYGYYLIICLSHVIIDRLYTVGAGNFWVQRCQLQMRIKGLSNAVTVLFPSSTLAHFHDHVRPQAAYQCPASGACVFTQLPNGQALHVRCVFLGYCSNVSWRQQECQKLPSWV